MIHWDQRQVIAVLCGELFQCADRLFAVCGVVINQRHFLARDITLAHQVVDRARCTVPVVCRIVKDVAKHLTVRCRCTTITHRVDRDAVSRCFGDQLICNTCGKRLIDQCAFALCGLVALNAFFSVIACLALKNTCFNATDTAVTCIEHREVIRIAIRERNAASRIRACTIGQGWEHKIRHNGACDHKRTKRHCW